MGGGASKSSKRSTQKRQSSTSPRPALPSHVTDKLRACLTSLPYLEGTVDQQAISRVAENAERVDVPEPRVILAKGEKAKGIYVVVAGEAQVVSASGTVIADLSPGEMFGEVSTLFRIPCPAVVKTPTKVLLMLVKPEVLWAAVKGQPVTGNLLDYFVKKRYLDTSGAVDQSELMSRITKAVLAEVPLFSHWGRAAIESLVKALQSDGPAVTLAPAQSLIATEDDPADEITIVVKGRVEVLKEKAVLSKLDSDRWPIWHGEEGLFTGSRSMVSVKTTSTCQMIILKNAIVREVVNKLEAADDFNKTLDKWRLRTTATNDATRGNCDCYRLEVLIQRLSETTLLSKAPLNALYKIALNSRTRVYKTKDCIIGKRLTAKGQQSQMIKCPGIADDTSEPEPPPEVNPTLPPGTHIKAELASQVFWADDNFLLSLKGAVMLNNNEEWACTVGEVLWVPKAVFPRTRLEAKSDSVILHFTGSAIDSACSDYPDVELTVPSTVR